MNAVPLNSVPFTRAARNEIRRRAHLCELYLREASTTSRAMVAYNYRERAAEHSAYAFSVAKLVHTVGD